MTRISVPSGTKWSTREPNLIIPTRCPRATRRAGCQVEDDAPREGSGDLLEGHAPALRSDGHAVLLVLERGLLGERHALLSGGVRVFGDLAR